MSTRDLLLAELYHTPRDEKSLARAARHAPVLYFDSREPFLPLAAGYTFFSQDGPSPSFQRVIELRPEDKQPAASAIEYAIWWDWDIHHLYELEHVWIYLDINDRPVRVEGSWHGKVYDIPLKLEDGQAVLLSEPGKHAFAPDPAWFQQRAREYHRADTLAVGLHAHVLINQMFAGQIRQRVFDRVLARSFLLRYAFTPSWSFSQRFTFLPSKLVPWEALRGWIPQRVNAVLERLETLTQPADYRALRLLSGNGSLASLQVAARAGADAVIAPVSLRNNRLVLGSPGLGNPLDIDEALAFCTHEPMGAYLEINDPAEGLVDRLAWFVRTNEFNEHVVAVSADARVLARYTSFVPGSRAAIQLTSPDQDPLLAAQQSSAQFVNPHWESLSSARDRLEPGWIQRVHQAGLGIISWPVADSTAWSQDTQDLQHLGLDVIWQKSLDLSE